MNNEEFSKALSIARVERPDEFGGSVDLIARFELRRSLRISNHELRFTHEADLILSAAAKRLKHEILCDLYEDRTRELYEAARDVYTADPYGPQSSQARSDLLRLATRQPSMDIYKLMKEVSKDKEIKLLRDRIKDLEGILSHYQPVPLEDYRL